jgi:hypothetical protein
MAKHNWTMSGVELGDVIKVEFRVLEIDHNPDDTVTLRLETVESDPAKQPPIPFVLTTANFRFHSA